MLRHRWIVVADSPFLPATGGGEQEHLGFARIAAGEGLLALLVLPDGDTVDHAPYKRLLARVPILATPRRRNPLLLAAPRTPFVVASRPAPSALVEQARRLAPDATGIVLFSYKSRAIGEALARGLGLPLVLRQHNREGAYHRSLADQTPGPKGWLMRWEAHRIERDERHLATVDWITGTADISAEDARWRSGIGTPNVIHVPPFALSPAKNRRDEEQRPEPSTPPRLLFLGTLDTATNIGALDWLLSAVWPCVRTSHPNVVLDVVGRNPSPALRRLVEQAARVELSADVPDPAPYLRRATVAVNPVVSGSGVNIKVVEYLDAALPLVSTSLATRGLPLRPGVDLEVHDDPQAFADAVLRLLADPQAARRMGETGQRHLRELLDPTQHLRRMAGLLSPRRSGSARSR